MYRLIVFGVMVVLAIGDTVVASERFVIPDRSSGHQLPDVRTACTRADGPECRTAQEILADQVANDLIALASGRDRQYRNVARQAADVPFPRVRAAAALALGAMEPDRDDTETLKRLVNDAVAAVRQPALRALGRSRDPARRLILERAKLAAPAKASPEEPSFEAEPAPDAARLGVPIYSAATFLHFASNLAAGRATFVTDDSADTVLRFYAQASGAAPMAADEFERHLAVAAPPMGAQDMQKTMDLVRRMEELQKSGKSQHEIMAEMQKLAISAPRGGPPPGEMIRAYRRSDLYGAPRFVLLSKPEAGTAAMRFVVVFQDHALNRTGIAVHMPADR